jgi:hypothetical protein
MKIPPPLDKFMCSHCGEQHPTEYCPIHAQSERSIRHKPLDKRTRIIRKPITLSANTINLCIRIVKKRCGITCKSLRSLHWLHRLARGGRK